MTSADAFFDQLSAMGYDTRLGKVCGSVRIDIRGDGGLRHWRLDIDRGHLRVSHDAGPASTVITTSERTAEAMAAGGMNGLAAIARGEILVDGDLALALRIGRLFPSRAEAGARPDGPDGGAG
ncbi:SCP2 sterol-binding domain-containing protein [Micromonospora sp. WMMD998]|uniref:SCP2 sterol-binding domain-containing protein n=1 Tax=Micromonospora sp. WMMD998 TaxID=3016092 RepID=UPI00249B62B5|nr:SCP2 sterol-binding domain-containing protein [Micromonospora sp. WMMD998]WFE40869.1 SCP2 sterol-binding domain-containing protein [Micromonospora sp. WMMD998]